MPAPTADPAALADAVLAGDRGALARAITLIESTRSDHRASALELLARLSPTLQAKSQGGLRIGVSGAPGVGKSTFIEAFGLYLIDAGHRVAVLTVDPSSSLSGGSILGDKTRMASLSRDPRAFIRPSPAGTSLGGVARRTRESVTLVEAAGHDVVLVETVGVGQSETAVAAMTDLFVLLLAPGGGDELQGIKRGIMELADLVIVNKADGELEVEAQRTAAQFANALRLLRSHSSNWQPAVLTCSALQAQGLEEVWAQSQRYREIMRDSGELAARRTRQALAALREELTQGVLDALASNKAAQDEMKRAEADVSAGKLSPSAAAGRVVKTLFGGAEHTPVS